MTPTQLPIIGMGMLALEDFLITKTHIPDTDNKDLTAIAKNKEGFTLSGSFFKKVVRIAFFESPRHALRTSAISLIASGLLLEAFVRKYKGSIPLPTVLKTVACYFLALNLIRVGVIYNREWTNFEKARKAWVKENKSEI